MQFLKEVYGGSFASEKVKTATGIIILLNCYGIWFQIPVYPFDFDLDCTNASNTDAVNSALINTENNKPIWAIVVVNNLDPIGGQVDYKIGMNFITVPGRRE